MTPRRKRFVLIAGGIATLGVAVGLVLYALKSNIVFFFTPTQVASREAPQGRNFRIGGLVEPGSVERDGTRVRFRVTDNVRNIPVTYVGTLPDLFREGKGVVAQGQLDSQGHFVPRNRSARQARRELHAAGGGRSTEAGRASGRSAPGAK